MIKIKIFALFLSVLIVSDVWADGTGSSTPSRGTLAREASRYEVAEAFRKSKFGRAIKRCDKAAFEAQLRQSPCFRPELEQYVRYAQIIEQDQLYIKKCGADNPYFTMVTQTMLAGMALLNCGLMMTASGYAAGMPAVKSSGKFMTEGGLLCLLASIIAWIVGDNIGEKQAEKECQNAIALREYLEKMLEQQS